MKEIIVTTSWDDGHRLDLRLAQLLDRHGLKGTFYVSPRNREFPSSELLSDREIKQLAERHEIGAHTLTHPRLGRISAAQAEEEISGSRRYLEELLGEKVTSFCYPGGSYNFINQEQVERQGFRLARTVERFALATGSDPFALPTSLHAYNHRSDLWPIARLAHFSPNTFLSCYLDWEKLSQQMFERVLERGGVMHLWGHSWEIDRRGDWARLERVLANLSGHPGVQYLTNRELADRCWPAKDQAQRK